MRTLLFWLTVACAALAVANVVAFFTEGHFYSLIVAGTCALSAAYSTHVLRTT